MLGPSYGDLRDPHWIYSVPNCEGFFTRGILACTPCGLLGTKCQNPFPTNPRSSLEIPNPNLCPTFDRAIQPSGRGAKLDKSMQEINITPYVHPAESDHCIARLQQTASLHRAVTAKRITASRACGETVVNIGRKKSHKITILV